MTVRFFSRTLPALFAALVLATTVASAQAPAVPGTPPPAGQRRSMPPPVNLKVLPKDIPTADLIKLMREYEGDLGVECGYCHAKDPATGRNNFASDANPMKDRARVMMKMTDTINATYLTQLTDPRPTNPVTCGTCHQGMAKPAVFIPKPQERSPRPAPPASTTGPK